MRRVRRLVPPDHVVRISNPRRQGGELVGHAPAPFDVALGARIRERRLRLQLTQQALASAIGVRYQQLQKYEGGYNRLHSAELLALASALQTTVAVLVGEQRRGVLDVMGPGWNQPDSLALLDAFVGIESVVVRRLVVGIASAMARAASSSSEGGVTLSKRHRLGGEETAAAFRKQNLGAVSPLRPQIHQCRRHPTKRAPAGGEAQGGLGELARSTAGRGVTSGRRVPSQR